jgi:hypothetical protein
LTIVPRPKYISGLETNPLFQWEFPYGTEPLIECISPAEETESDSFFLKELATKEED